MLKWEVRDYLLKSFIKWLAGKKNCFHSLFKDMLNRYVRFNGGQDSLARKIAFLSEKTFKEYPGH